MFNFKWTKEEADLVFQGLAELPAKISYNIITKFQQQYTEQVKNSENGKTKELEKTKKE